MATTPNSLELLCQLNGGDIGDLGPALHRHHAVLGIDADHDPAGKAPAGLLHQLRVALGGGADDHPGKTEGQIGLDGGDVADAAAQLGGDGDGPDDRLDGGAVLRLPGKGAVQVDDVQQFRPLRPASAGPVAPGSSLNRRCPAPSAPVRGGRTCRLSDLSLE